ncbi:MAG: NYN domain-containing protein [Candidatus Omnitrophota bacterium]
MYQKIREYLNESCFSGVILDSIPQPKIASLMSRLNIEYIGVRITSIPAEDLANDLAKEAFINREVMDTLIKILDKANFDSIQRISQMPERQVRALVTDPNKLCLDQNIGQTIWGLLSDTRKGINELIPRFFQTLKLAMRRKADFTREMEKEVKSIDSVLSSKKGLKKIEKSIALFKNEIAKEKKISEDFMRENRRLNEKYIKQQELIHQLRKSHGELIHEKGLLHKQIMRKDAEIGNLSQQIKVLKDKLAVGPKIRLKSEIHRLEKENSKLNYIFGKEGQENRTKISELEKELLQLKDNFNNLQQTNLEMQQQLESEQQKFNDLEKEYQLISVKNEPLIPTIPKGKGKRLGIFIDNQNVYYSAKMQYGKKLDFRRLLDVLIKDRHLVKAICYLVQQPEVSQERFMNMLKNNGYMVRVRDLIRRADGSAKGNWDIGIATDVITMVEKNNLDIVILVTCDGDFVDLIKLLSVNGTKVEVVGFSINMAMDLKKVADEYYFITEDLMITDT